MILVDSSVWISLFRQEDTAAVRKLADLASSGVIIVGDLVLLELLQGARDEARAALMERYLRAFPLVSMMSVDLAVAAAQNYRTLRRLGITTRKTVDLIIGTFCIEQGHTLLYQDRDFDPMVRHLGLRVVSA
jgi:predicted nucleic acid-binding protein